MNKKTLTILVVLVIAVVGMGAGYWALTNQQVPVESNLSGIVMPTTNPDINGDIVSIIGNEITIKRYISTTVLTDAEKAAQKAERQKLSVEERQALKAAENADTPTETIKITIPVGTQVVKSSDAGTATGTAGSNLLLSSLDEAKSGYGIQIWKNGEEIILVKLKAV